MELNTDWATIKAFVNTRSLSTQYFAYQGTYFIWAIDGSVELMTRIPIISPTPNPSDQYDFETNYQAAGNKSPHSNVIQILGADTLSLSPFGALISPAANAITNCDIPIPMAVVLRGGVVFSPNSTMGDWFSVSVIDKNNVVGAGGTADNPTILATYIASWYLMPGVVNSVEDVSISQPLPSGLYMRVTYTSVGTVAPSVVVNFITYVGIP